MVSTIKKNKTVYDFGKEQLNIHDSFNTVDLMIDNGSLLSWYPSYFYLDYNVEDGDVSLSTLATAPDNFKSMNHMTIDEILSLNKHSNNIYQANFYLLMNLPNDSKCAKDGLFMFLDNYKQMDKHDVMECASLVASGIQALSKQVFYELGIPNITKNTDLEIMQQLNAISKLSDSNKSLYIKYLAQTKLLTFAMFMIGESA